jgi:16S rRNA processing protein RimM
MTGKRGGAGPQEQNSNAAAKDPQWVILGRVSGLFGVRGWVKVFSHTSPRTNILEHKSWYLLTAGGREKVRLKAGRAHGKGIVVQLEGFDDRDRAAELLGTDIAVPRDRLPPAGAGEFYWTDLEGLRVQTLKGEELGRIDHLIETGANDVMVVKGERERLIPFIDQVISEVDLDGGLVTVDWDPDF